MLTALRDKLCPELTIIRTVEATRQGRFCPSTVSFTYQIIEPDFRLADFGGRSLIESKDKVVRRGGSNDVL